MISIVCVSDTSANYVSNLCTEAEMVTIGQNLTSTSRKCRLTALGMTAVLSVMLPSANSNAVVAPHIAAGRAIRGFITPVELCEGCGGGGPIGGAGGEAGEGGAEPRGPAPEPARPVMPNVTDAEGVLDDIQVERPRAWELQRKLRNSRWTVEPANGKPDWVRKKEFEEKTGKKVGELQEPPGQGGGTIWTNPAGDTQVRIMSHKKATPTGTYLERRAIVYRKFKGEWQTVGADGKQPQAPKGVEGKAAKEYRRKKAHFVLERYPIKVAARAPSAKAVRRGMVYGFPVKRGPD